MLIDPIDSLVLLETVTNRSIANKLVRMRGLSHDASSTAFT